MTTRPPTRPPSEARLGGMHLALIVGLFTVTAIAEIAGCDFCKAGAAIHDAADVEVGCVALVTQLREAK